MAQSRSKRPSRRRRQMKKSKKGPTTKALSRKVKLIENTLIELKYSSAYSIASTIPNNGFVDFNDYLAISQGDEPFQRNGNKIYVTSLSFGCILQSNLNSLAPAHIRCVVVLDKAPNGIPLSAPWVFDDVSATGNYLFAPRNQNYIKRFKILYDKLYQLTPQMSYTNFFNTGTGVETVTATLVQEKAITVRVPIHRVVNYTDATAVLNLTNITTNVVSVLFCGAGALAATVQGFDARMFFKDA